MEIPPNYGTRYTKAFRESFQRVAEETSSQLGPFMLDGVDSPDTRFSQVGPWERVDGYLVATDWAGKCLNGPSKSVSNTVANWFSSRLIKRARMRYDFMNHWDFWRAMKE